MTPNIVSNKSFLLVENNNSEKSSKLTPRKYEILYIYLLNLVYVHIAALYGVYLCFTKAMWSTMLFHWSIYIAAQIGVTAGAHRLWSHRAYKAKWPLQIILMIFQTLAAQNTVVHWVRDHRVHHKYTDTDADPHNASRGLFFSHVGWLMVKKHTEVIKKGKTIDFSDIYSNPILRFQKKHGPLLIGTLCFVLPTIVPLYFWEERLNCAWHLTLLRYAANLNASFLVNSAAHLWGNRPYDKSLKPVQSVPVAFFSCGEGFHNYHHVFPWDYKAAELGNNTLNITTLFIDFFAILGWAYDLKTVRPEVIQIRQKRTGDGSNLWGWNDKDLSENDKQNAQIINADNSEKSWAWDDDILNGKDESGIQILNLKS